jgi:hypothetical protein
MPGVVTVKRYQSSSAALPSVSVSQTPLATGADALALAKLLGRSTAAAAGAAAATSARLVTIAATSASRPVVTRRRDVRSKVNVRPPARRAVIIGPADVTAVATSRGDEP